MADELNLTVPERKTNQKSSTKAVPILLVLILLSTISLLVVDFLPQQSADSTRDKKLSSEKLKELALKFEKQGLQGQAIAGWQDYLAAAELEPESRARIYYRIGTLRQDLRQYDDALGAYYRAEAIAKLGDLESDINQRVQECLEAAGRYAALEHELADRVSIGGAKESDQVLAEIGARKITRTELDRKIDELISQQLDAMAGYMPPEQRKQQTKRIREQFKDDRQRSQILQQLIVEELLYRKAREDKLADNERVKAEIDAAVRSVLASQVLNREVAARVNISERDVETWYKAHQDKYRKDDKVQPFADVRDQIYRELRQEKEQEAQAELFERLKEKYDVVIHMSKLRPESPPTK